MHLSGEPERQRPFPKLRRDAFQDDLAGNPPELGILLGPSRTRCRERIFRGRDCDHVAIEVDGDGARAGRADVESDQRFVFADRHSPSVLGGGRAGRTGTRTRVGRRYADRVGPWDLHVARETKNGVLEVEYREAHGPAR